MKRILRQCWQRIIYYILQSLYLELFGMEPGLADGNIWGGEFFKYENNEMLRCYHFDYFPVIAGDKMAMEPRISALCVANAGVAYRQT